MGLGDTTWTHVVPTKGGCRRKCKCKKEWVPKGFQPPMSSLPLAFCPAFFPNSDSSPLSRDSNSVSPHTPRISRAQLSNNDHYYTRSHLPTSTHSFLQSPLHPEARQARAGLTQPAPRLGWESWHLPRGDSEYICTNSPVLCAIVQPKFSLQNSYQVYKPFQFKISPVKPLKQKWNQLPTNKFISFETLNYCLNISISS